MTISIGKKYLKIQIIIISLLVISLLINLFTNKENAKQVRNELLVKAINFDDLVFSSKNSNNITGFKSKIVPNVVNYVVLDNHYMDFNHYISVKSVLRHHKPIHIVIHCNCADLKGKYWSQLRTSADSHLIRVRPIAKPDYIFGVKLSSIYHISDVVRIEIMKTFGGIYLDNDVFVVKSLDTFRKYEFTIGWPHNQAIGNQVLIGHKNARFPRLWYDSYRKYRPTRWYYNAGQLPTQDILEKEPALVHRVVHEFGTHTLAPMLYNDNYPFWQKNFYTIHLLARHRSYLVPNQSITYFDEHNIKTYDKTFGQMARLVLYNTTDIIRD